MKFERDEKYMQKLFEQALFDEKNVIQDASIIIAKVDKLKAWCENTKTYLQFPRNLREYRGQRYIADVVEVINPSVSTKYYRVMKGSIRKPDSDEVVG